MSNKSYIEVVPTIHYIKGPSAIVTFSNSTTMFSNPDTEPKDLEVDNQKIKYVPWGDSNNLPAEIIEKIGKSPQLITGLGFLINLGYGDGVQVVKRSYDKGTVKFVPNLDNKEINEFFDNNDINHYLWEQLLDLNYFYNAFPEIILNRESPQSRKIVELNHKEADFSRWGYVEDNVGEITKHVYSAKFHDGEDPSKKEEFVVSDVLSSQNPTLDLKRKIGREPRRDGKTKDDKVYRYIIPLNFPSPGRLYYKTAPWYSVFESGWYDLAIAIPKFKKALMSNQMTIKYHIELSEDYFELIFKEEGITDDKKKQARIALEYKNFEEYLKGSENSGKSVISKVKYFADGREKRMIKFNVVDNKLKDGAYIEDSEEVSNILSYSLGVHQSLIGSTPGKNKTINGTEARELFIIKQQLMKMYRDRLLMPLYIVKAINKWPDDIFFRIPNLELTTLDNGTGSIKTLS
jgi:hypothetical protein